MKKIFFIFLPLLIIFLGLAFLFAYNNITVIEGDTYYTFLSRQNLNQDFNYESKTSLTGYNDKEGAFVMSNCVFHYTSSLRLTLFLKIYIDLPSGYTTIREFYNDPENQSIMLYSSSVEVVGSSISTSVSLSNDNPLYSNSYVTGLTANVLYDNNIFCNVVVHSERQNSYIYYPFAFDTLYYNFVEVFNATTLLKPDTNPDLTGIDKVVDLLDYYIIEYPVYIFSFVENFFFWLRG